MMNTINILLGGGETDFIKSVLANKKEERWIGVDAGAHYLIQSEVRIEAAIGDFDSVSSSLREDIKNVSQKFILLDQDKDLTDSEYAIRYALSHYPQDKIVVYLTSKGRLDHLMANLLLASRKTISKDRERIELRDENNVVNFLNPGNHQIGKIKEMTYWGLISLAEVKNLSLKGFKYPLSHEDLPVHCVYSSNEFIKDSAELQFSQGILMVIQSKDK